MVTTKAETTSGALAAAAAASDGGCWDDEGAAGFLAAVADELLRAGEPARDRLGLSTRPSPSAVDFRRPTAPDEETTESFVGGAVLSAPLPLARRRPSAASAAAITAGVRPARSPTELTREQQDDRIMSATTDLSPKIGCCAERVRDGEGEAGEEEGPLSPAVAADESADDVGYATVAVSLYKFERRAISADRSLLKAGLRISPAVPLPLVDADEEERWVCSDGCCSPKADAPAAPDSEETAGAGSMPIVTLLSPPPS